MPVYDFRCSECSGEFSELRPMARSGEPSTCPDCEGYAPRLISAPRLAVLTTTQRKAHQVNERSAHEPRAMKKHVCSSGCSHGPAKGEETKTGLRQSKSTSRPWMIGH
ncbi:MAG: zinc ribbon domain-containing protein [Spongiibacteraceae bacterium]